MEPEMRYRWTVLRERGHFLRGESYIHLSSGITRALRSARPEVLIVGGLEQPAYLQALALKPSTDCANN